MYLQPKPILRVLFILTLLFGYSSNAFSQIKGGAKSVTDYTSYAKITATAEGKTIKYTNPYTNSTAQNFAGVFNGTLNSHSEKFYCIDLQHSLVYNQDYWDEGNTPSEITYILNNYFPYKTSYSGKLSDNNEEAAAVQISIWHFSDGVDANTITNNTNVKNRALAIIADANANHNNSATLQTLIILPSTQALLQNTPAAFDVYAFDINGNPASGIAVQISATLGSLNTNSGTTDANGHVGPFTLSYNGTGTATIKVRADVEIPQGTRYVHKSSPNDKQKLVLATPSFDEKEITATVEWYNSTGCDLHGYTTFTPGGWGSSSNSTPGKIRDLYFSTVFPSGLTVGGNYTLELTSASAVKDFLPSGGTPSALTQNYTDPGNSLNNTLAGHVVTLTLNVEFDRAGYLGTNSTNIANLVIASGTFAGLTVDQFLAIANTALGGGSTSYSYSDITDAATAINENFDNGTVDNGFLICNEPKASLGDKVWEDTNKDGIQDSGENGITDVTVKLYDCNNNFIASTTTDANGNYLFSNLTPGDYYVEFVKPATYVFTTKDAGSDDAKDSDADETTGKTICTTLTSGENDLTWDAGLYKEECKSKIGNFVWHDKDVDGIQDSGEPGIPGVIVELLLNGNVISTTTTDASGKYEFANLSNGTYEVRLSNSNFQSGGTLYSTNQMKWYSTKKNQGTDDTIDSDANSGEKASVTLNCNDDLTIDFGFFKTCVSIIKTANKQDAVPGDIITYTFTIENCGDLQLHGGVDVFDAMLNPNGDHKIKHIDVLNPGETYSFSMDYTATENDCGLLINTAIAEGHPVEGSSQNCDTNGFTTYTPGGWGSSSNSTPGQIRDQYFSIVFPAGLIAGGNKTLTLTSAQAVEDFLPSGGTPSALTQNYTDPGNSLNNTFAGHVVTLTLNVEFDEAGYVGTNAANLGDLIIASGTFAGMSVNQFLALANAALGGGSTTYTYSQFTETATAINENFDNGTVDNGFLTCSGTSISYAAVIDESSASVNIICDEKADLMIEKLVDDSTPECGDQITYTIKVTNNGPAKSKGIVVSDLLPSGLIYSTSTPSQGTYDANTGIWTIGDLNSGASATLTISATVDCSQVNNSTFNLGPAADYNLFVLNDANQPSSDTQGKVAVGHDAYFANYSIGDQLPANSGDVLIVGHDLTFISGAVYNGNVVYGNTTNLPQPSVSITGGTLRQDNPINFASAKTYLENLSTTLSTHSVNGTTTMQWGGLTLTGTDPFLNVFAVSGSDLSSANNVAIDVPNGAVVLVNIDGTNVSWTGGLTVTGTSITNVLYNFYQAATLTIQGIDIRGSLLAPFADVDFVSGVINGQMICKSLTGMGQMNLALFIGNIPFEGEINNIATITSSLTPDPDSSNNSDNAIITINNNNSGNNNQNNGNGNENNWQYVNGFASGEIVYTMAYDGSGNIYAGTWGGKIYKSTDGGQNWTVINSGMNVSFIWSLQISGGYIFAATEQGVFKFDGSTWTLTSLNGKDVHALAISSGVIYAGTWGEGVFTSTDNGATWNELNDGFEGLLAIQSLTVSASGEVFAASFGGGVFKLNGTTWVNVNVGYNFVWALGANSNAIFAGTYGDGLYRSLDNGSSWSKVENLTAPFIYSIAVDGTGKVYVASWTSGVFVSTDNGNTWSSLGMGGFGVSSLLVSSSSDDVFVGTKEGKIFLARVNSVTDVGSESEVPTEFALNQNYPNPFNPSTTIRFAVPEAGRYTIKIYNILGQEVVTLLNEELNAGMHNVKFNAINIASGMYIYKLSGEKVNISKKMILMK